MSFGRTNLRATGRIAILSTALGLALVGGLASTASANTQNPTKSNCVCDSQAGGHSKGTGDSQAGWSPKGSSDSQASKDSNANDSKAKDSQGSSDSKTAKPCPPKRETAKPCPPKREKAKDCPPKHETAKPCPPKHETHKKHETPPVVTPAVVVSPAEAAVTPVVAKMVVAAPVVVTPAVVVSPAEAAVNPLPTAAAAGQANTDGQLTAGGAAGLAAFLTLGAGFVLRRRHGEV
jgi:hypothetical protein